MVTASEIALYWGQTSSRSLLDYCSEDGSADIYVLSFLNDFGSGRTANLNIGDKSGRYDGPVSKASGSRVLQRLSGDIEKCQEKGKKIFLSLGGGAGKYGFKDAADASNFANYLWEAFLGGSGESRPFGNVKIDGFDLDIEAPNDGDPALYIDFVNELRNLYSTDSSKDYYVSAAPQPPLNIERNLGDAVKNAWFDYLLIQFYNNGDFDLNGVSFKGAWNSYQNHVHEWKNPSVKLLVGLPGNKRAAGNGYVTIDEVKAKLPVFANSPNFDGFSVWEAGQETTVGGKSYSHALRELL